jgi:hypothetical protein
LFLPDGLKAERCSRASHRGLDTPSRLRLARKSSHSRRSVRCAIRSVHNGRPKKLFHYLLDLTGIPFCNSYFHGNRNVTLQSERNGLRSCLLPQVDEDTSFVDSHMHAKRPFTRKDSILLQLPTLRGAERRERTARPCTALQTEHKPLHSKLRLYMALTRLY